MIKSKKIPISRNANHESFAQLNDNIECFENSIKIEESKCNYRDEELKE